jgi:hypothetical protein
MTLSECVDIVSQREPDRVKNAPARGIWHYPISKSGGHFGGARMTNRQLREGVRWPAGAGHPPSHRFEEARNAHDVHHADEIVGQRRQAEFGPDLLQPAQEKGTLVHPLLDAAERVLGDFPPLLQNLGSGRQPCRHALEHRLFGPAANPPIGIDLPVVTKKKTSIFQKQLLV